MSDKVREGDLAPDFELPSQKGETIRLSDYRGEKVVVLYFYPRDDTAGCTKQACRFRDQYDVFLDEGAEVIGISSDPIESHQDFASKYDLPFPIVSDEEGAVRERYGATTAGLMPGRVTYVMDHEGVVRMIFSSQMRIGEHIDRALGTVRKLVREVG